MGVAVGEGTACTYEGLWNIKGRCCSTATGIKWEPDCVATSQLSFFIFLFSTALCGSLVHIYRSLLDLNLASLLRVTAFEVLSESANNQQSRHSTGSFDVDPRGDDRSQGCDECSALTRLKKKNQVSWWLELNTLNQVSCASHSETWTSVSRRTKAGQTRQGLGGKWFDQVNFCLAPCSWEQQLNQHFRQETLVSHFKAFKLIFFPPTDTWWHISSTLRIHRNSFKQ